MPPSDPGNLGELGEAGRAEWAELLATLFKANTSDQVVLDPDPVATELVTVDWDAFPARIERCLGSRENAWRLLDWRTEQGDVGRARLQEEYAEWRLRRDKRGRIKRFEMTTELPEYWETLAAHDPMKVVRLVDRFSGDEDPDLDSIFGGVNPFSGSTPGERLAGFREAMLPSRGRTAWSPYNNGREAICFMTQPNNTLDALVALVLAAAFPFVDSKTGEPLTGPEAIASTKQAAVDCRSSDPTIVGKLIEVASAGHLMALDDPVGIYIRAINHESLETPDGDDVPAEWFDRSRGSRANSNEESRAQRLTFAVPDGLGFGIEDLIDRNTDRPIQFGGQIAALVRLGVYLRISEPGVATVEPTRIKAKIPVGCEDNPGCKPVAKLWRDFEARSANLLRDVPEPSSKRSIT